MPAYVRVTRAGEEGPLTVFVDTGEGVAHAARTAAALARERGLRLAPEADVHGVSFFGVGEGGGRALLVWLGVGPGVPRASAGRGSRARARRATCRDPGRGPRPG